jgi:anti-anti-sigma regulatory factor
MSGYHSFELCYLATVYTNLLITRQPVDFYFKPQPGALKDNLLRVQPDILPPGSARIEAVWINGLPYDDFDPEAMTVKLPAVDTQHPLKQRPAWAGNAVAGKRDLKVRVRLVPTGVSFDAALDITDGVAKLVLYGVLDDAAEAVFKARLDSIIAANPTRVVLDMEHLQSISVEATRMISFVSEKLELNTHIQVTGLNKDVKAALRAVGIEEAFDTVEVNV